MARGSIQTRAAVPLLLPIYTEMINNLDNATGVEELPFSFSAKKPFTTGDLIRDGKDVSPYQRDRGASGSAVHAERA